MNPQLTHLLATSRTDELRRVAEQARLAKYASASDEAKRPAGSTRGPIVLLRLATGASRLRIRRA